MKIQVLQIGHVIVSNFNIHIWAGSGDFIVTNWRTGTFVIISEYNGTIKNAYDTTPKKYLLTRKSITYNYMLYKGVVVSKINNHYSIIYLGLTN